MIRVGAVPARLLWCGMSRQPRSGPSGQGLPGAGAPVGAPDMSDPLLPGLIFARDWGRHVLAQREPWRYYLAWLDAEIALRIKKPKPAADG